MTKASKATAIRLTVEAVGVVLLAVLIVAKFEDRIAAVNWRLVSLVCVAAAALFGIYRWQMREDNKYDVMEMLMKDGRADLSAHLIVVFAGLSIWVVVQQALAKQPVTELLLGILAIFVGGKVVSGFSEAMQKRPPPVDQSRDINVLPGAIVQPATPTADAKG